MRVYCTEELHASGGDGTFFLAKAEDALDSLLAKYENSVRLIYLDPPFRTGESFKMKIGKGKNAQTVVLYEDKLDEASYLAWLERILEGCHKLLDPRGSIYLHLDYRMSHKARMLLDRIFGESNFMNEIIWAYRSGGRATRCYPRKHDTILFYRKSKKVLFNIKAVGTPRGPERRNHMKRFIDEDGRIGFSIRSNGKTYTYYEDSLIYPSDVWSDIEHLQQKDRERTGFLTQKPEALLKRIIAASSEPGDLVLDLFSGSGTTAAAATRLNRRFLAVDQSPVACALLRRRQLTITSEPTLTEYTAHPLLIRYPADQTPCRITTALAAKGESRSVQLKKAVFSGKESAPIYAATGYVDGACFHALHTNCAPKLPVSLPLPKDHVPVLHVVGPSGEQAFFTLE
ncbi:MAG: site-specific DNA-methyltransferase [Clostridia bacterium]|nr:site-specific DNA-methyltransferase [Clostridia bacterium]